MILDSCKEDAVHTILKKKKSQFFGPDDGYWLGQQTQSRKANCEEKHEEKFERHRICCDIKRKQKD
jgi:hypothetical protein